MGNSHEKHMFISLVSADATHAAKALRFGRKFLAAGWSVTLSISVDGVRLVDPNIAPAICPITERPLPDLLTDFLAEGGRALAGAECLKLENVEVDKLPAGVEVAKFELMDELLSRENTKTLTW